MLTLNLSKVRFVALVGIVLLLTLTPSGSPIFTAVVSAHTPNNIIWSKTYGPGDFNSVVPTSDGGYIAAGVTRLIPTDGWVIKLDADGNQVWSKTFGGTGDDHLESVLEASDGGYIAAGTTAPGATDPRDGWVIKMDTDGNQMWSETFGGTGDDYLNSLAKTSDGGYLAAGTTGNAGWVIKLDASGNQVWAKTYNRTNYSASINAIAPTSDGNYVIAGYAHSQLDWIYRPVAAKLDPDGNLLWYRALNIQKSAFYSTAEMTDGNYVAVGIDNDCVVDCDPYASTSKLDPSGNMLWHREFFAWSHPSVLYSVAPASNGGAIVVGEADACNAARGLAAKLDANGNQVWSGCFGSYAMIRSVARTQDGSYVAAGGTGRQFVGAALKWSPNGEGPVLKK